MKITYDKSVDAAYIYFSEYPSDSVKKTYPCDPKEVNGMINLDFDEQGRLVGVEVIDASKKLPKELLDAATRIDK
jgi:uncharacterized protein YuzE